MFFVHWLNWTRRLQRSIEQETKADDTLVGDVQCYTAVLDWEETQSEPQPQFGYSLQLLALFMLLSSETFFFPFLYSSLMVPAPCWQSAAFSYFTTLIFVLSVRKDFWVILKSRALGFEMQCLNRFASQKNHCSFVSLGKFTDTLWVPREELFALT